MLVTARSEYPNGIGIYRKVTETHFENGAYYVPLPLQRTSIKARVDYSKRKARLKVLRDKAFYTSQGVFGLQFLLELPQKYRKSTAKRNR
jgi:hypothetical protein